MRFQLRWFGGKSLSLRGDNLPASWPSPTVSAWEEMAENRQQPASRDRGTGKGGSSLRAPVPARFRASEPQDKPKLSQVRTTLVEPTVEGRLKTPKVASASSAGPGENKPHGPAPDNMIMGRSQTPQVACAPPPVSNVGLPGIGRGVPVMRPPDTTVVVKHKTTQPTRPGRAQRSDSEGSISDNPNQMASSGKRKTTTPRHHHDGAKSRRGSSHSSPSPEYRGNGRVAPEITFASRDIRLKQPVAQAQAYGGSTTSSTPQPIKVNKPVAKAQASGSSASSSTPKQVVTNKSVGQPQASGGGTESPAPSNERPRIPSGPRATRELFSDIPLDALHSEMVEAVTGHTVKGFEWSGSLNPLLMGYQIPVIADMPVPLRFEAEKGKTYWACQALGCSVIRTDPQVLLNHWVSTHCYSMNLNLCDRPRCEKYFYTTGAALKHRANAHPRAPPLKGDLPFGKLARVENEREIVLYRLAPGFKESAAATRARIAKTVAPLGGLIDSRLVPGLRAKGTTVTNDQIIGGQVATPHPKKRAGRSPLLDVIPHAEAAWNHPSTSQQMEMEFPKLSEQSPSIQESRSSEGRSPLVLAAERRQREAASSAPASEDLTLIASGGAEAMPKPSGMDISPSESDLQIAASRAPYTIPLPPQPSGDEIEEGQFLDLTGEEQFPTGDSAGMTESFQYDEALIPTRGASVCSDTLSAEVQVFANTGPQVVTPRQEGTIYTETGSDASARRVDPLDMEGDLRQRTDLFQPRLVDNISMAGRLVHHGYGAHHILTPRQTGGSGIEARDAYAEPRWDLRTRRNRSIERYESVVPVSMAIHPDNPSRYWVDHMSAMVYEERLVAIRGPVVDYANHVLSLMEEPTLWINPSGGMQPLLVARRMIQENNLLNNDLLHDLDVMITRGAALAGEAAVLRNSSSTDALVSRIAWLEQQLAARSAPPSADEE